MLHPTLSDAPILSSAALSVGLWRGIFGESTVWSGQHDGVWWVDMHGHSVNFTGRDGTCRLWKTPSPALPWARAIVPLAGGGFLVALSDTLARFDPDNGQFSILPLDLDLPPGHLFNDATVDSAGRLIIGTMLPGRGDDGRANIYQICGDLRVTLLVEGLNTTNGLAFSPDGRILYFSDSYVDVRKVWAADYDPTAGTMDAARVFVDFAGLPGKPDGAAVDSQGGYWSAAMTSPFVHRFTPDGRLDFSLELPIDTPTRPAFGGQGLRDLYLSTGGLKGGETDDGLKGAILRLQTAFAGAEGWPTRVGQT